MNILARNKSGWELQEYLNISEIELSEYPNVTGAFAIITVNGIFLIGYNSWRGQWEFPAGGIEENETARQAAVRELFEETHQKVDKLAFKGLFKVKTAKGDIKYQAAYYGKLDALRPFVSEANDEMAEIMLWDGLEDIGYVDEIDLTIARIVKE
ncbi:NUDIX hydrolase [Hungatella effluvii]|uniref:NUDIX hydrolase n=1 Tax=Hungatella effluvii TaxID=1096246 RepID=UPI0022DF7F07|nr:NUDIX hydrolase [Hungatella effluvii]